MEGKTYLLPTLIGPSSACGIRRIASPLFLSGHGRFHRGNPKNWILKFRHQWFAICSYFPLIRFLLSHELRVAIGAGNKRTRATNGAAPERPLAKAFVAISLKSIKGNMNLRNTNAMPETKTLTYQGHSISRLSMDSSFRAIIFLYLITDA